MAILTHLYSREMQNFVNFNQEEHKKSDLVQTLWNGAYSNNQTLSEKELHALFYRVNQPYREKLNNLFDTELRRVKDMPA